MRVDGADGVRTVTLDKPEAENVFTADVTQEFSVALGEPTPEAFDAAVITGDGDTFGAGNDIQVMAERDEAVREACKRVHGTLGRVARAILTVPVPVVTRANGGIVGAGTSVIAACGFTYATRDARSGVPFVNVGLTPDAGATVTPPRLVNLRTAKELTFTGRLVSAERTTELDLVDEAIAAIELDVTMDETAEMPATQPTETLALAKETIHADLGRLQADGFERGARAQTLACDADVCEKGVAAFLKKRRPRLE